MSQGHRVGALARRPPPGVRILDRNDLPAAMRVLATNPVENVFVSSRIHSAGLEAGSLGCPVWGFERDGVLRSLCHAGANLVPVNADAEAIEAWVEFAGPERMCFSIVGSSEAAMGLWQQLSDRWGAPWSTVRDVRPRQPVMVARHESEVAPDPRVRRITIEHWDAYHEAAVKMYTEEVGVSPDAGKPAGYKFYVRQLITSGRAFGLVDRGRVLFKADIGSVAGSVCQVQGVWLDPALRGQGMAAAAMAAVVQIARQTAPEVSLYVNDYNLPALATYRRVGFVEVGQFATIHY